MKQYPDAEEYYFPDVAPPYVDPCAGGLGPAACGQKPQALGTVSGFGFCGDTNSPARLAYVVLRPVPAAKGNTSAPGASDAVNADGSNLDRRQLLHSTDCALAGTTSLPSWMDTSRPWPRWESATLTFSILMKPPEQNFSRSTDGGCGSQSGASVNVSLERGAAVAGTILFDDGSPAPGLGVNLLTHKQGKWVPIQTGSADGLGVGSVRTDDRGHYRISGLPAGRGVPPKGRNEHGQ